MSQAVSKRTASVAMEQKSDRPEKRARHAQDTAEQQDSIKNQKSKRSKSKKANKSVKIAPVTKRERVSGKIRKLGLSRTSAKAASNSVSPQVTLSGQPIRGKNHGSGDFVSATSKYGQKQMHHLWVSRKANYSVYLKRGISAFVSKGAKVLELHALGAAIPMCLSLSQAIQDSIQCRDKGIKCRIFTGSEPVTDEVTKQDEEDEENDDVDIVYQTRMKNTVHVILSIE